MTHNARLDAAELLLQEAEYVIELLLGDAYHAQAQQVLGAIESHWQTYPNPTEEPPNV